MSDMSDRVRIKVVRPALRRWGLPCRATEAAAGFDVRACVEAPFEIAPGQTRVIPSGFAIDLGRPDRAALLIPRSGLGAREGIVLGNLTGLIDADYHGEVLIALWNRGSAPVRIEPGMRVCQLVVVPVVRVEWEEVEAFPQPSARGAGGFGHTGVD